MGVDMKCQDCPSFDKETQECSKSPSKIEDILCLLRHIAWATNILIQDNREDREEGEGWKNAG